MTRRHPLITKAADVQTLLTRVLGTLPDALNKLEIDLRAIDGYGNGGGDGRGGTDSTSVESAIMRRERLNDELHRMRLHLAFIGDHCGTMLSEMGAILGRPHPAGDDFCNRGRGMPGAIDWADPLCERLAAVYVRVDGGFNHMREGLCDQCYRERLDWQNHRGRFARSA